ncbi:solute carrier family 35 member F5-like [Uloborus diversus]|uniref:solute carrier family 35 member F5-like n=1 Tax=Uloborus diversus TaxID=327109 RepID=UPI002408F7B5|nr:solute carrier family 35 member F5-like [Uloborus diversus]XP_054708554.1 solute carrier family 35 member F5-like [Uloborus diversus]
MAKLNNANRLMCGTLVLLIVDIIWVASSELTKYIFKDENYSKPFFSTYVKTTMFMLYLLGFIFWKPWRNQCAKRPKYTLVDPAPIETEENDCGYVEAEPLLSESIWIPIKYHDGNGEKSSGNESDDTISNKSVRSVHFNQVTEVRHLSESQADDALLARLSYAASLRAQETALKAANKLPMKQVAHVALLFCILWFLGNLSYQEALSNTEAGIVNILSCSSGLFTLILASMFPANSGDRFTLSKLLAVITSIAGVAIIANAEKGMQYNFPPGAVWSILGAFFYAAYVVLLRRKVDDEDTLDIPMFFGFVGLFNLLFMWPGFLFLHYTKVEEFQWPSRHQWLLLLCNGLVGTVFSELLWLWGCFLTSSLIATLSVSLTIPLTILFDVFLKKVDYPLPFFLGTLPMFLSFFAVAFLTHYENWDPVLIGLNKLVSLCWKKSQRVHSIDYEQTESLISVNSEYT